MSGDWVYGIHAVTAVLDETSPRVCSLHVDRRREAGIRHLIERARALGIPVQETDREAMDRLLPGARTQGVAAQIPAAPRSRAEDLPELLDSLAEPALLLALDGVQDPRNLGACLRTAWACGAHALMIPKDRAVGLTPAARKVASGAAERVPLYPVTNLARALAQVQQAGVWAVGLEAAGEHTLYELDLTTPTVIVMGSEGRGLRRLVRQGCDWRARIPMAPGVESLNVSVAAGVALFEARRQRLRIS